MHTTFAALLLPLVPMPQEPLAVAATATNGLAVDLYRHLAASDPQQALFLSPWSIATALAMTAEGARAETAAEMRRTLHLGDGPLANVHASFAALQQRLTAGGGTVPPATRQRIADLRAQLDRQNAAAEAAVRKQDYKGAHEAQRTAEATAGELNQLFATADCYDLRAANSLWGERSAPLLTDFLGALDRHYGTGGANLVDFRGDAESARQRINGWVAERTERRIENLIPVGGVDAATRLVLANAVYFLGQWQDPFEPGDTSQQDFTRADGQKIAIRLMRDRWRANVPYAAFTGTGELFATPARVPAGGAAMPATYPDAGGFQIAQLPYKGGDLAMAVLLPRSADGLARLEQLLTAELLTQWFSKLDVRQVDTALPRWQQRGEFRLGESLRGLGMQRAFVAPTADGGAQFEGINGATDPRHKLFIGEVFHQAFVDVTEKGTEAAAATAVMVTVGSAAPIAVEQVPFVPVFRADRPFLFVIRDTKSGAVLFLGRVLDPASAG